MDTECVDFRGTGEVFDASGVEEDELEGGGCHADCKDEKETGTG